MVGQSLKIRAFIALPVDKLFYPEVTDLRSELVSDFALQPEVIQWTNNKQLHLTLFFLGDQTADALAELADMITKADVQPEIDFHCTNVGLFPEQHPTVIALTGECPFKLMALRNTVASALSLANTVPHTTHDNSIFLPHVTLGKVKQTADFKSRTINLKILFSRMVLFRSELRYPEKVVHTPLYTWAV